MGGESWCNKGIKQPPAVKNSTEGKREKKLAREREREMGGKIKIHLAVEAVVMLTG